MTKVLIIEDDLILLKMYKEEFEKKGFVAIGAERGQEGLDLAASKQPDFILLDLMMPVMDGIVVLKKLKENPLTQKIPVAILTVIPDEMAKQEYPQILEQVTDYWRKDQTKPSEIAAKVSQYINSLHD